MELKWYNEFKLSFDHNLILDRQFLSTIESLVCISNIDEEEEREPSIQENRKSPIDALKLIYAKKYDNTLQFRELPVSLSRLYFSGRNRVQRFIRNLNNWQLDQFISILENDAFIPKHQLTRLTSRQKDDWTHPVYNDLCLIIEEYVVAVLDLCLTSFETCMNRTVDLLSRGQWLSANLFYDLRSDSHWKNFPVVFSLDREITQQDLLHSGHMLWLVSVWRINTTLMISRLLSPWETLETEHWIQYKLKLFRDTHLDLLTEMVKSGKYSDTSLYGSKILHNYYPSVHRVLCVEELPDFIRYSTDNFKTGTNLKERNTRDDKFGHIFINKTSPNICKIRNMFDISIRYGEQHPIIYASLKNILRCMLLGNIPKAEGELCMMARIRINASFHEDEADKEIPLEVFKEATKNKSLKRDKVTGEEQMQYTKTNFKLWLLLCRHFFLFLLKEYLIYIAESSGCFDEICSATYKWTRCKEIIRIGNGRSRNILSEQAQRNKPFDWNEIEFEEKSKTTYDMKSGEIKKFHHWTLKMASKIKKDDFLRILVKKMTGTEKQIPLCDLECENFYQDALVEGEVQRKMTLDQFHFLCWYMVQQRVDLIETKWFQVMGMTKYGLTRLRNWQCYYYKYDIPDNSLNDHIEEFRNHSMQDYYILKTTIRVMEYYEAKYNAFYLSIDTAKNQLYALRKILHIGDYEATPSHLGVVYQCVGCLKFANSITLALTSEQKITQQLQIERARELDLLREKESVTGEDTSLSKMTRLPKQKNKKLVQNNYSYSFLNKTFYNVEDNLLYCTKYVNPYTKQIPGEENMTVIIRKKNSPVTIESSKNVPVKLTQTKNSSISKKNNKNGGGGGGDEKKKKGFFCNERNIRDRAEKKLEWLMQTSSRDALTNGVESKEKDKAEEEEDDDEEEELNIFAPITNATSKTRKNNIKKIIHNKISDVITKKGFTCQSPLIKVNMIGLRKNGKASCEICGLMTEMRNHNMMSDGRITCGRHREWFHPPLPKSGDKAGTKGEKLPSSKHRLNPIDLITLSDHVNTKCHFCPDTPKFRLAVVNTLFKIQKICLCKNCFDKTRSLILELNTYEFVCSRFQ